MRSITTVESDSDSVVLKKTAKCYNWDIKVYGTTIDEIMNKINAFDTKLKEKYGNIGE